MKAILFLVIGAVSLGLTGCQSDPSEPEEKPKVVFGNDQFRDDVYSRPTSTATDLEKTPW